MKHLLVIDDKSIGSKSLLALAQELSKTDKGILLNQNAVKFIGEIEDEFLVQKMKIALKSGMLSDSENAQFKAQLKKDALK